jgi:hypothetical protein
MPKPRSKDGKATTKVEYVVSLVDILRIQNGNDYEKVAKYLQLQSKSNGQKKGFGSSPLTGK